MSYLPTLWQEIFHRCTTKGRMAYGGNRTGKTNVGCREDWYWLTGTHPWLDVPKAAHLQLVSPDMKILKSVILGHGKGDEAGYYTKLESEYPGWVPRSVLLTWFGSIRGEAR